jgi:2-polyprenyl-3-methyl-5-hydroxy-6-metoxy-1,4-benzoquinol methylase
MIKAGLIERKNRKRFSGDEDEFNTPKIIVEKEEATSAVIAAFDKFKPKTKQEAQEIFDELNKQYPDDVDQSNWWDSASQVAFRNFFIWGHDHDFGFGILRKGAMSTRHLEITSEAMSLGFLPKSLEGKKVLDVGMWTGGDLIILAGLGGSCLALEESPMPAKAAKLLTKRLNIDAEILTSSVYQYKEEWKQSFDYIYCSGVLYHVTDPLLFLRILFCYLSVDGELFIETKAAPGKEGFCSYSGVLEKGWNWYAPDELTLGRWFVDAGFHAKDVTIYRRDNGRLLGHATKKSTAKMVETAGFSRPDSWLEKEC